MASLNQCQFIGNVGRDPEVKTLPSGKKVANFSIAVSEKFKDRNGQQQEKTEWISCVAWDGNSGRGLASIIEQYVRKGSPLFVSGTFTTRSWDDANSGEKRYKTEINVRNLQMLGGRQSQDQSGGGYGGQGGNSGQSGGSPHGGGSYGYGGSSDAGGQNSGAMQPPPEDDLPF